MPERDSSSKGSKCSSSRNFGCCNVQALIPIDARGQLVLPKEVREKAGIKAGDKLALITCETGDKICCISLVKATDFAHLVKEMLGPMFKDILET